MPLNELQYTTLIIPEKLLNVCPICHYS